MLAPPPVTRASAYPVVTIVAAAAVGVTIAAFAGRPVDEVLGMDRRAVFHQPWRWLTSTLRHADVLHLGFDVFWLWVFGTLVEERLGQLRAALSIALFGAGSALAQYALDVAGTGLSGVGYGLLGMLYALDKTDRRFTGTIDRRTLWLFGIWFVACVITTRMNVLPVANVAHAAGFLLGVLLGFATGRGDVGRQRAATAARRLAVRFSAGIACAALFGASAAAASSSLRPRVTFVPSLVADEIERQGTDAVEDGRPGDAVALYQRAVSVDGTEARRWYNLGIAYGRTGDHTRAIEMMERAVSLAPSSTYHAGIAAELAALALQAYDEGRFTEAASFYERATTEDGQEPSYWLNLGLARMQGGQPEAALTAFEKARSLAPNNARTAEMVRWAEGAWAARPTATDASAP
jgi:membrane associated rhomboid family serine protease